MSNFRKRAIALASVICVALTSFASCAEPNSNSDKKDSNDTTTSADVESNSGSDTETDANNEETTNKDDNGDENEAEALFL